MTYLLSKYTVQFEHLMVKYDDVEPKEQMVTRYLGGLRIEISNIVQLQLYWTIDDIYCNTLLGNY